MADKPYDLAILGAGQAGCTLAGKIAEHGVNPTTGEPLRIALLDRGPPGAQDHETGLPFELPKDHVQHGGAGRLGHDCIEL